MKNRRMERSLATPIEEGMPSEDPNGDLVGLPLIQGPGVVGVIKYERRKCYDGYTLFSPRMGGTAYLVDMEGRIVHTWPVDGCQIGELLPNGHLLADHYGRSLYQVNLRGQRVWSWMALTHHDFYILPNGNLLTMLFKDEPTLPGLYPKGLNFPECRTDVLIEINRAGDTLWEFDFGKHRAELHEMAGLPLPLPKKIARMDWAHNNTIEALPDTPLGRRDARFRQGNILFSMRQLDIIGVVDREKDAIVWAWGRGILDGQHQPTMLPNGNILIFDNGTLRGYSSVLEVNPATGKIVWNYEDRKAFYSPFRSGAERLPNGNTLICSCDQSRMFEVTPDKEIVWDYYPPFSNQCEVGLLSRRPYRAIRYSRKEVDGWLENRPGKHLKFVPVARLADGCVKAKLSTEPHDGISMPGTSGVRNERSLYQANPEGRLLVAAPIPSPPKASGKRAKTTGKTSPARTIVKFQIVTPLDRMAVLRISPKAIGPYAFVGELKAIAQRKVRTIVKVDDSVLFEQTLTTPEQNGAARGRTKSYHLSLGELRGRAMVSFIVESVGNCGGTPLVVDWGVPTLLIER